ncbi:hypothetical protein ACS0TY_005654 [Phlomoides rotata]
MSSFLTHFDLGDTGVGGNLPESIFEKPSLQVLILQDNKGLADLQKLTWLRLDDNDFIGIMPSSLANMSQLQFLVISYNALTGRIPSTVTNMSQLQWMDVSSNKLTGPFPSRVGDGLQKLIGMVLSHNSIQGMVPSWLLTLPSLETLDLSSNKLTGEIENFNSNSLYDIDLSNNLLNIDLHSFSNLTHIDSLHLSHNTITEQGLKVVNVLDLRRNKLHGKIPTTIGGTNYALANLVLNGNHLEGALPRSLASCTQLEVLDVGNNKIQDTFPSWLQNLTGLIVLILKSNCFHGSISPPLSNINSFSSLQIIDVSHNNFTGILPEKLFARLQGMKNQDEAFAIYLGSDLYEYHYSMILTVKGADREFTRVLMGLFHRLWSMMKLEELDLSSNQLRGGIPQALTNLTFLAVLNLSFNHLVGPIPKGNQFQTFSNESYVGNPGLCGDPLTTNCGGEPPSPEVSEEEEDEDDGFMMGFTWKTVVIGYGCGIVLGFIMGNVMISAQKPKWVARFVYTEAAIILKRRKKKAARKVLLDK